MSDLIPAPPPTRSFDIVLSRVPDGMVHLNISGPTMSISSDVLLDVLVAGIRIVRVMTKISLTDEQLLAKVETLFKGQQAIAEKQATEKQQATDGKLAPVLTLVRPHPPEDPASS